MAGVSQPPLHVRFVALNAYPAIDPEVKGAIGGMETRAWMLARALSQSGWFVDFVVRHTAPLRQRTHDGVRLRGVIDRLYRVRESVSTRVERKQGFPFLKFHSFAPSLLWQLPLLAACWPFRRKPAGCWTPLPACQASPTPDLLCTFGVQGNSARVIASAREVDRPVVLFLVSDSDLDERYAEGSSFVSPYGDLGHDCWRVLREANAIVCQTEWQQSVLKERFGREATILNNPIDIEGWDAVLTNSKSEFELRELAGWDRYLLWVGRSERVHKRPQLFVELMQQLPEARGVMILNPRDDAFESELRRSAPSNLKIVSHVPFPEMPLFFSRAAALVNTSSLEGFANVFLQAALSRAPVVSLQVGDSFLAVSGAGVDCAGDWTKFVDAAHRAWTASPPPDTLNRAREYVIEHHSLPRVIERLQDILVKLGSSPAESGEQTAEGVGE